MVVDAVRYAHFDFREHVQYVQFGESYTGKTKWTNKLKVSFLLNTQVTLLNSSYAILIILREERYVRNKKKS